MAGNVNDEFESIKKKLKLDVNDGLQITENLPVDFDGFTPNGNIEIESLVTGTNQTVPIYRGYTIKNKKTTYYKTAFVQPVAHAKKPYPSDVMIIFSDLAGRATTGALYDGDLKKFEKGKTPFPLWNPKGPRIEDTSVFKSIFDLDPEKGDKEAQNLFAGSKSAMWKTDGTKRIRKPRTIFGTTQPDLDTRQMAVIKDSNTEKHPKYKNFIFGTIEQCHASSGVFNVMSRFFNEEIPGIKLNVRITIEVKNKTAAISQLKDAWETALTNSKFKPILGAVWFLDDEVDESKWQILGTHPGGLYEIWMTEKTADKLREQTGGGMYPFPTEAQAKQANKDLGLQGETEDQSVPNRSTVTDGGIRSAGTTARNPQQIAVMNYISPNDLVRKWWGIGSKDMAAEWLHRCAFSYGGVHVNKIQGPPNSAQIPSNFIIGTCKANTAMLRTEGFIKRAVQYSGCVDIQVDTVIAYPTQKEFAWMKDASYLWLAPLLTYQYTLSANQVTGVDRLQYEYTFSPFSADQVTRFEIELDLAYEELCLGLMKKK
ncbi:hypothetical protein F4808DRAFT_232131 [Astrocystis sublimbata]|nr:hypothetical protein F4808DRAFT_232131 [Astrocystis sublimbata]